MKPEVEIALEFGVNMVAGGVLALFIRLLYRRFGSSLSNRDNFGSLFPLLTITVVLVISVVKESLSLSLGLVGALSIVRFRTAIKDPEELIYLFACIAVGVALGADQAYAAVMGVLVFTIFVLLRNRFGLGKRHSHLLLTIAGDRETCFDGEHSKLDDALRETIGSYEVQRFDVEGERVQMRAVVAPDKQNDIAALVSQLQSRLPGCQVTFVNLDSLL